MLIVIITTRPSEPMVNHTGGISDRFNIIHLVIQQRVNNRKITKVSKFKMLNSRNFKEFLSILQKTDINLRCKNTVLNSIDMAAVV